MFFVPRRIEHALDVTVLCASVADAPRDRAGVNVAVVDVPAVWAFRVSAAGEGGHAASKRDH
jgi:hypothetical protein